MGEVKFKDKDIEYKLFLDFWHYVEKYYNVETNDDYWENAIQDGDNFYKKYKGTDVDSFASELTMAYLNFLEVKHKKKYNLTYGRTKIEILFAKVYSALRNYKRDADQIDELLLEEELMKHQDKTECKLIRREE